MLFRQDRRDGFEEGGDMAAAFVLSNERGEIGFMIAEHIDGLGEILDGRLLDFGGGDAERDVDGIEDVPDVVENGGGDLRHAGGTSGFEEFLLGGLKLLRAFADFVFDGVVALFEQRLARGDVAHFADALDAGGDEEDVFINDPSGVFKSAPERGREDAIDRHGEENSPEQVIGRDDGGGGDENAPITIKCKKGEGAEDLEMHFNAPVAKVYEEAGDEHLRDRDGVACQDFGGECEGEINGQGDDGGTEEYRGIDVRMDVADGAAPRTWRTHESEKDTGDPFKNKQAGE